MNRTTNLPRNLTITPPANPGPDVPLRYELSGNETVELQTIPIFELPSEPILPQVTQTLSKLTIPTNASPATPNQGCSGPPQSQIWPGYSSQPSVRSVVWLCWNFATCKFIVRVGPIPELKLLENQESHLSPRQKRLGFGVILSASQLKYWKRKIIFSCYLLQPSWQSNGISLQWNLDFPRRVSQSAAIFGCVSHGAVEEVKQLFADGKATARDVNVFGITALHIAAKRKNLGLVRLLLREGADVNAQDDDGDSPLHGALAIEQNYDVARILIEKGADLASTAIDGKTPLHSLFNTTIAEVLTKGHCIERFTQDSEGLTVTHFLGWSSRTPLEVFRQGHKYDTTDLWAADSDGRTCLHLAASKGNLPILAYLLERAMTSEVNRRDADGLSPLDYATRSSRASAVTDMLIASGCSIDVVDNPRQKMSHQGAAARLVPAKTLETPDNSEGESAPRREECLPSHAAPRKAVASSNRYPERLGPGKSSLKISPKSTIRLPGSTDGSRRISEGYSLCVKVGIILAVVSVLWQTIPFMKFLGYSRFGYDQAPLDRL